jgi:hypothetical protein
MFEFAFGHETKFRNETKDRFANGKVGQRMRILSYATLRDN